MGRYLERAQRLCVLLGLQAEALVDRPVREIYFGWSRIYDSVHRHPPGDSLELFDNDEFTLADSYTLADDLTFERANPDSVWSCFALGRENARQMRHCISAEMWTRLNLAYLRIQKLDMETIWRTSPESFYAETAAEIDTFGGVAASTMYRDDGWQFMQLGCFIERAQLLASLLLAQLSADTPVGDTAVQEDSDADWASLLRACHAFEAYHRRYGVEVQPGQALDLLVTDRLLPNSLGRAIDMAATELAAIGSAPDTRSGEAAQRLAGRMGDLVHYDWPDRAAPEDREACLQQLSDYCRELHNLVTAAYFDYPVDHLS